LLGLRREVDKIKVRLQKNFDLCAEEVVYHGKITQRRQQRVGEERTFILQEIEHIFKEYHDLFEISVLPVDAWLNEYIERRDKILNDLSTEASDVFEAKKHCQILLSIVSDLESMVLYVKRSIDMTYELPFKLFLASMNILLAVSQSFYGISAMKYGKQMFFRTAT